MKTTDIENIQITCRQSYFKGQYDLIFTIRTFESIETVTEMFPRSLMASDFDYIFDRIKEKMRAHIEKGEGK